MPPRSGRFLRGLVAVLLALASASVSAAMSCAELEALGSELTAARDSQPAAAVERGSAALRDIEAGATPCPAGKAMLVGAIASNLNILGRDGEAVKRYEEAIRTLGDAGTPAQVAFLHRGLGVALVALESYQPALAHYLTALAASEAADDRVETAKTAGNIGNIHNSLGDFEQARAYHRRSLDDFEAAGFKPGIAGALVNLGAVAAKFGEAARAAGDANTARREHEDVKALNERALALFDELRNPRGIAYAASNIGLALDRLGQPTLALVQHQRSLALRREVGDAFGTLNSLLSLGTTLTSLKRYDEAASMLDEVLKLTPPDSLNMRKAVAEQRVLLEEARGDLRAALAAQRDVTHLSLLIADESQRNEVTTLQNRFNAEQSAKQIETLRSEAVDTEASLQQQRLLLQLSALAGLAALGMFVVMLSRYRIGVTAARTLQAVARTDPLTGMPNRRHLRELMEYETARVARGGASFCLLMADLDDFKRINDQHGHEAGDAVLVDVARRLRETVRKQDTVARWGGEEFLLLLPQSSLEGARVLADKLRDRIAGEPFAVGRNGETLTVTLTIGLSQYVPGTPIDDGIKAADEALYQGKREGKNRAWSTGDRSAA